MNIPALGIRNRAKLIVKNSVGRVPGKKYLFLCFLNGFQDIQVYALCPSKGISIEKKEQAVIRFFPEKRQRIYKNQRG
jgi:hypothetical protein